MTELRIPITLALTGILSGGLTLVIIFYLNDPICSPGVPFAAGLWLGIRIAQHGGWRFKTRHVLNALLLVVLGYPILVWTLLAIYSTMSWMLIGFANLAGIKDSHLPIAYWVGLLNAGVLAAMILWGSLRALLGRTGSDPLWWMMAASLLVCTVAIGADYWLLEYQGHGMHSKTRAWTTWLIIFVLGNTVMSFAFGLGLRAGLLKIQKHAPLSNQKAQ